MAKSTKTQAGTGRLSERMMIVNLHVGRWDGRKRDAARTGEVLEDAKAQKDAGSWWTRLIPRTEMQAIYNAERYARDTHDHMTLPWNNDGSRILPAPMYIEYTAAMRKAEREWCAAVDAFVERYPEIRANARNRLGDLYDHNAYPDAATLRHRFPFHVRVMPMPDSADFRVALGEADAAAIRQQIEADVQATLDESMRALWQRLYDVVARVVDRLGEPDAIFRDSLISNARDLCDLLPRLNVTGDANLEDLRQRVLTQIVAQEPETLRKDKKVRKTTAKSAKAIMDAMAGFMGNSQ